MFVQSVIPSFDIYSTFSQSEEPLVHLLQESTLNLYKTLVTPFIKPNIIAQSDDILSIDIKDSTNYKESSSVHIGYLTKQYTLPKDLVETSKYTKFKYVRINKSYYKTVTHL